ncbi:hypothetical protein NW762_004708 [Fusarium torreyae]|uniref:Uncharacterized protein n=1 Tax=Fusarium torreyae TaxID=1237075 RepID=A0A9W8S558_9HYPO|nr:hypothetical protein NW762_004708 [Fusarium torreyae]
MTVGTHQQAKKPRERGNFDYGLALAGRKFMPNVVEMRMKHPETLEPGPEGLGGLAMLAISAAAIGLSARGLPTEFAEEPVARYVGALPLGV